jgi:hypothetical protein
MPIKPQSGEREDDFISRCIGTEIGAGIPQDQAVAICYSTWREDKGEKLTMQEKVSSKLKQIAHIHSLETQPTIESTYPGESSGSKQ